MPTLDVFNQDAFSALSLTAAVEKVPHLPQVIGEMNIFEDVPVRTTSILIEERSGQLTLIPTDSRGAPPKQRNSELRTARSFSTVRLAQADVVRADELQNIRAFGSETELMQVQAEVARRMSGPTGLQRNIEYTWEYHRLGAIQGIVLDADGSPIYNWFNEFGISQPAEIDFDLDNTSPASGALRKLCAKVKRDMARAAKGAFLPSTKIGALCGDNYWDDLIAHPEVRETYKNWQQAEALRGDAAWTEPFYYGGIGWVNYRGSDDNSEVAIGTDKVKFFPVGAPGVFQTAWAPHNSFDFVNTLGKNLYGMTIPDRDRNAFVSIEMYSYPLFYCTRPAMLLRGKRT